MTRSRPAIAAVAAGVVATVLLISASPANASVPPAINVESPAPNAVLTDNPTISGVVSMPGTLDNVGSITVSLSSLRGAPDPCDPCNSDHGHQVPFSWAPALAYNGPYQARVHATGSQFLFGVFDGESSAEAALSFQVEVMPADPEGVSAALNPDRTVTISWARNGEPDMVGYRVQRKDPGGSLKDVSGPVAQPAQGSTVSIVDPTAAQGAGDFVYQVQAIRVGRTGDAGSAVGSGFSAAGLFMPALPGAPATPATPAANPPAETPAPGSNLSAFLRGGTGGAPKAALPAIPAIPDGGYDENLPFMIPPGGESGAIGEIALEEEPGESKGRGLLVPFAGGLLLCVAAFHIRRLNGWLATDESGEPKKRRGAKRERAEGVLLAAHVERPAPEEPAPAPDESGRDESPLAAWSPAHEPSVFARNWQPSPTVRVVAETPIPDTPVSQGRASEAAEAEPGEPVTFEKWLNGANPPPVESKVDDFAKWAPARNPGDPAPDDPDWESIFSAKSGAGRTQSV